MKAIVNLCVVFFLHLTGCTLSPRNKAITLEGDYVGQICPGKEAKVFAPGFISTGMYERDFAISPKGDEVYYSLFQGDWNTIMVTRRVNNVWQQPVVAEFARDTTRFFAEASFSADGERLYFLGAKAGWAEQDIWVVERQANNSWGEPQKLPEIINEKEEFFPSLTRSGTLYFCRTDEKTRISQILRSKLVDGEYQAPEVLPSPINARGTHFNACISPDDSYLIGCVVGRDSLNPRKSTYMLFLHNPDDTWSEGIDLIERMKLPSSNAISVSLSPDGRYFFFATTLKTISFKELEPTWDVSRIQERRLTHGNGNSDIYWVRIDEFVEKLKQGNS